MEEEDVEYMLGNLSSQDPKVRANALRALSVAPIADQRVLTASEKLLDDRAITLLSIPYQFGEVRWHAADAVAAVRGALGLSEPVALSDVLPPSSTDAVARLAQQAGLPPGAPGVEGVLEVLRKLVELGAVPRRNIRREP